MLQKVFLILVAQFTMSFVEVSFRRRNTCQVPLADQGDTLPLVQPRPSICSLLTGRLTLSYLGIPLLAYIRYIYWPTRILSRVDVHEGVCRQDTNT